MGTKKWTKKAEEELARADLPLRPEEFAGIMVLSSLGLGLIAYLGLGEPLVALLIAGVGIYLPWGALRFRQSRRLIKFNLQLPEALLTMANALRSGFSFLQAMDMIRREMPNPISREFGLTLLEINWGTDTEKALINLGQRVKSEDLDLVVTALLIQRQVGGNLAEVLENISHTISERVKINSEIKALTAQGRISGFIISLLPLALAAIIQMLNPSYLNPLFSTRAGLIMLTAAATAQIIGVLLIRRIVHIEF
ncbi:MAG: type II secretion system F family protein [Thermanaeromonas sp.]|uniref:type II secretion system F family protein n=1 Tax=Thermanaeromonas sp. TaxID=2003697 RepID=UPI00243AC8A2|nr:type II secretion system F family protein [Thermanaeromonas sp.]MCG0278074.1 type II secretion system F family protein [Thermanaeromonas sp.]